MSQWSEKIPKENLSKTVSSTRYLFLSFSEMWIQINHFRKSSKKFITDLLTKNVALNLSGAIFFVGLGYSLKWWYKDQLFVVLLKQNLPALSESQKNISWDLEKTGESILNNESKILLQQHEEYQTWTPFIDRIDLYANHIRVKFKQPWQKHVSERFIGVFGEPAQANISKQVLTIPFTREKDWWKENTNITSKRVLNDADVVLNPLQLEDLYGVSPAKFSTYTLYTPKKPIFPKKWFKLSPRNICSLTSHTHTKSKFSAACGGTPYKSSICKGSAALNQEVILLPLGSGTSKQRSPFSKFSKMWAPFRGNRLTNQRFVPGARENPLRGNPSAVLRMTPGWGSWRSEAAEQVDKSPTLRYFNRLQIEDLYGISSANTSTDKLSYPLQLTKKLAGWQPFPNLLVLNSYLDEIPYKLENALQSYFPKENSQLLFLSTSFKKSINSRIPFTLVRGTAMNDVVIKSNSVNTLLCKASVSDPSVLQSNACDNEIQQHEVTLIRDYDSLAEELVMEELEADSTNVKVAKRRKGLLYKLKNNWVSDSSAHYKTSETENNEPEKTLDLFKELFLVPTKQSETYLKKLDLFETKKLLQNQFASLINSFPINLVEKSKVILEKDKHSHTGDELAGLRQRNNELAQLLGETKPQRSMRESNCVKEVIGLPNCVNESVAEGYWGTKVDRLTQLFTYSNITNAVDVEGLDPLVLLNALGFTFNNFSPLTDPPILLSYDKLGVISNKVTNISKPARESNSTRVAKCRSASCNAATPKKSESGNSLSLTQLLLNPFTLTGYGVSCTDPSSSKYKFLQQHEDSLLQQHQVHLLQQHEELQRKSELQGNTEGIVLTNCANEVLVSTNCDNEIVNDGNVTSSGYPSDLLYKLLCVAKEPQKGIFDSYRSISFYFNPKNLNWIVFQHPTNEKFNLFLKKICVAYPIQIFDLSVVKDEINKKITAYPQGALLRTGTELNTGLITNNQPITTQLTNLIFEFLKGKTGLSYVYPFGLGKDNYVDSKGANNFTHYLSQPSWQSKEGVAEKHFLQQHKDPLLQQHQINLKEDFLLQQHEVNLEKELRMTNNEVIVSTKSDASLCQRSNGDNELAQLTPDPVRVKGLRKLKDLLKINTIINNVNRFTISSNVNKINFKQKETKIETLTPGYKINVVDKDINFDKNLRYMSGYVYPDIQSNSLKTFLYQWLSSCTSVTPYKSSICKGYIFDVSPERYALDICNSWQSKERPDAALSQQYVQNKEGPIYSYGISSSLIGSKEKTGHTNLTSSEMSAQRFVRRADAYPYKSRFSTACGGLPFNPTLVQLPFIKRIPHTNLRFSTRVGGIATNNQFLENNQSIVNIEVPYKRFNHYLAKFPGFSDPNQFFITLPQISCGNENLVNESQEKSILGELPLQNKDGLVQLRSSVASEQKGIGSGAYPIQISDLSGVKELSEKVSRDTYPLRGSVQSKEGVKLNDSINIIDKSEINKKFIQKNGCDSRNVAYSGIVVRRNKWTKDFQPFKDLIRYKKELFKEHPYRVEAGASKSSIWGTLFLGPENPLTDRQCHFFGQKQLSTLDTNSLQRDYLRQLGKEILTQSNSKNYTELSKFSSIERTKILSLSKKVNSFFFKRRKYSYLLEPKDQWHLLFQEQLYTALEDCKKYPLSTIHSFDETNIEKLNTNAAFSGRIKVSAPLIMVRFPKKLVQPLPHGSSAAHTLHPIQIGDLYGVKVHDKLASHQLEQGISWRPFCHLAEPLGSMRRKDFIYAPPKNLSPTIARENLHAVARGLPHYPLFTERFSEEINAVPCLNKNSLFYSAIDSLTISSPKKSLSRFTSVTDSIGVKVAHLLCKAKPQRGNVQLLCEAKPQRGTAGMRWKNMKSNLLGIQNMCTSRLIQEPATLSHCNSWAVLNQWVFLIALLFWVEQTLSNNVFPALFALEQILLSAAGLRAGENNRTQVLRISKNETPKFQNLAGIDGLLGELSELVLFLRGQQNLGERFWNKWNKKNSYGVLLTGSPGTGKTFLVRALANEAKVPVLILSASTLTASKLNNNKPSWSIRHAFKRAKQLAPCILFIDEIDALGKSRGKIVTDINEIVADTNSGVLAEASFLTHKLTKSTHYNSASPIAQQMFSYEQFGQNCSNFNATLLNKWQYPLQSTILQESNEINQNSLCQEKLGDLLKIAGGTVRRTTVGGFIPTGGTGAGAFTPLGSEASESLTEFKKESTNETNYSRSEKGVQQLATLEKETTRGKFGPLTQLLVSMDGVSSFSGVLIMGATNRPELLDPALTRPGRFEKIIRIDKPSEQNRIEILQLYSQNLGVQEQIPWSYLATRTIGLTTADLAVAMNYSSLRAIIQDSVHTLETIEYGLNCITRL